MENKKTKIAIVILIALIIALIGLSYFYSQFNTLQLSLLTEEVNKILQTNLIDDKIDLNVKTEKDYAEVEKAIKEYLSHLKNIHVEMKELVLGINPNSIFSTENVQDKKMDEIDNIIKEYKEKSQNLIKECEELVTEQEILKSTENIDVSVRNDYYINVYKEIMLSEVMQKQYQDLEEEVKNEKARLYEKLNKLEKIKVFLEENEDSWIIKNDKIQFTNLFRMTEYYNLVNQVID
ncbi:MAG: hypothetical protein IJE68_06575 [Clostridia bacterium]|nr:hypothetical protein [Clostridia bacterium]